MKPASPSQATVDFDLNNRLRWSEERRPDPAVDWLSPPPAGLPVHEHTKLHYLLKDETMSDAGFDPAQLPDIAPPAAAIPPAAVPAAAAPAAAPSAAGASSNLPVPAVDASAADATPDGE
jgi:hypothetical protein